MFSSDKFVAYIIYYRTSNRHRIIKYALGYVVRCSFGYDPRNAMGKGRRVQTSKYTTTSKSCGRQHPNRGFSFCSHLLSPHLIAALFRTPSLSPHWSSFFSFPFLWRIQRLYLHGFPGNYDSRSSLQATMTHSKSLLVTTSRLSNSQSSFRHRGHNIL